jgi:hypothetical protein
LGKEEKEKRMTEHQSYHKTTPVKAGGYKDVYLRLLKNGGWGW